MTTDIEQARAVLARKHRVPAADLRYIGLWDTGWRGRRFWMFNILQPGHPKYKSTICLAKKAWEAQPWKI